MIKNILLVGLGGFLGSVGRYLVHIAFLRSAVGSFPLATFLANIFGCLLIGFFIGFYSKSSHNISNDLLLLFTTGFCGGFTTFSTFALENVRLYQQSDYLMAALYIGASIILGLIAAFAGIYLGKY